MPNQSSDLNNAKRAKNDEFYTQIGDIEKEMDHYDPLNFKDKIVYCNCDDPKESKFYQHFKQKFGDYGLKELITTCYKSDNSDLFSRHKSEKSKGLRYDGKSSLSLSLGGDGDFRSDECIELLKQADIVVTNPPFSLFREYLAQLIKYEKQFIILGNMNAIGNKEVFPLFEDNKVWYGPSISSGDRWFGVPDHYPLRATGSKIENGAKFIKVKGVRWFTNFDHSKRHQKLVLFKKFTKNKYPKYDNYDAIEVSKTVEIPKDYDGIMGVPVSFMDKYNPDQFEILGLDRYTYEPIRTKVYTGDLRRYNGRAAIKGSDGSLRQPYWRILIRRKP